MALGHINGWETGFDEAVKLAASQRIERLARESMHAAMEAGQAAEENGVESSQHVAAYTRYQKAKAAYERECAIQGKQPYATYNED